MKINRREMIGLMSVPLLLTDLGIAKASFGAPAPTPSPRLPLDEFVQSDAMLKALRKGVRAMKARKPSDPLSWFYQAAIHGVTPEKRKEAIVGDPNVSTVPESRWNQCPHHVENSANFLPWHRAYTYHFEKILRMHTEEDTFSLPYWDYSNPAKPENRMFPKEFGIEFLDGNQENKADANINPLYLAQRDHYLCAYEHPFVNNFQPLVGLSEYAVDVSIPMSSPVFFGATEQEGIGGGIVDKDPRTRGLIESYPHDQIHRAVGGIVFLDELDDGGELKGTVGFMANPPTAGFDPIFPVHHSNIDRLWAKWSCMPGKSWGNLPPVTWFNESPWIFYDVDGKEVNEPRKRYFDHRALGVQFKDEDLTCSPLQLPDEIIKSASTETFVSSSFEKIPQSLSLSKSPLTALATQRSSIALSAATAAELGLNINKLKITGTNLIGIPDLASSKSRLLMRMHGIDLRSLYGSGFDVHLVVTPSENYSRKDATFVGSISLFNHPPITAEHMDHGSGTETNGTFSQTFDITRAAAVLKVENLKDLKVIFVPYSLLASSNREILVVGPNGLKAGQIEFLYVK